MAIETVGASTDVAPLQGETGGPLTFDVPEPAEWEYRWAAAFEALDALRSVQDDYDGMGSPAPGSELIDAFFRVLAERRGIDAGNAPAGVSGSADGSIVAEWRSRERVTELRVSGPREAKLSHYDRVTGVVTVEKVAVPDLATTSPLSP